MVKITPASYARIQKHGERTYPEECCGILLGTSDGDSRVVRQIAEFDNNQDENRRRRFFVTPQQYMQAERIASESGQELLGFYHSHPDHPAAPSEFDRDHALPWFVYIVLGVAKGKAGDMTAWILSETREKFIQVPFTTVEPAARETAGFSN